MQIKFTKITIRNLLSVGDNPFSIQLDRSPTTHVTGKNGVGKSSILAEGLTYGLFGKSFRGLTLDALTNNINKKGMWVEVEFVRGDAGNTYTLTRGHKPKVFELKLNGEALPEQSKNKDLQQVVERLLGFDYSSFIKTIVLGHANYKSFLNLTTAERRAFVDFSLNTEIFTLMAKQAAVDLREHKALVQEKIQRKNVVESVYQSKLNIIEQQSQDNELRVAELRNELGKALALIEQERQIKEQIAATMPVVNKALKQEVQARLTAIRSEIVSLEWEIDRQQKDVSFFKQNETCPTCSTLMTEEHRESHISTYSDAISKCQAQILSHKDEMDGLQLQMEKLLEVETKAYQIEQSVNLKEREIQQLCSNAQQLGTLISKLSQPSQIIEIETEKRELVELKEELTALDKETTRYQSAVELLKDTGIKTAIVTKYLPIFNQYVNQYLDILEFGVRVRFDANFNEQFIGRYVDEYTYQSFSQGERERIDLALMFAWRAVIALSTGVNTNLLILDEIGGSSLDAEGVEGLFRVLDATCTDQNVFIISHRLEAAERCRSTIKLIKKDGFVRLG